MCWASTNVQTRLLLQLMQLQLVLLLWLKLYWWAVMPHHVTVTMAAALLLYCHSDRSSAAVQAWLLQHAALASCP